MQQFTSFVIRHWELWLTFVVLLVLFLIMELRLKLTGAPQLSPQAATLLMNREDILILDIRDNTSFLKGHIVNAVNVPLTEINEKTVSLNKYKGKSVLIIYGMGQQPQKAVTFLQANGFDKIHVLQGSMSAWQSAGLPQVKGK